MVRRTSHNSLGRGGMKSRETKMLQFALISKHPLWRLTISKLDTTCGKNSNKQSSIQIKKKILQGVQIRDGIVTPALTTEAPKTRHSMSRESRRAMKSNSGLVLIFSKVMQRLRYNTNNSTKFTRTLSPTERWPYQRALRLLLHQSRSSYFDFRPLYTTPKTFHV